MEPNLPFENKHKTAKLILVILAVAVVGFSVWVWRANKKVTTNTPTIENKEKPTYKPPFDVDKQDLKNDQTPQGLPADLPIDKSAKVVSNFNATTAVGSTQGTKSYETTQTLAELEKTYRSFFEKKGWQVSPTFKSKSDWAVTAVTDTGIINADFSVTLDSKVILVIVTYRPKVTDIKK